MRELNTLELAAVAGGTGCRKKTSCKPKKSCQPKPRTCEPKKPPTCEPKPPCTPDTPDDGGGVIS